jgi:hypothetical protein
LGTANTSIAAASLPNSKSYNQSQFLAIELGGSKHLTLEYGLITNEHLIGLEVQVNSCKTVRVRHLDDYEIEFELCELVDPEMIVTKVVDSGIPHITLNHSGFAKPVHSGWWGWIVQKLFSRQIGTFEFGQWSITIEPCEKSHRGVIKLF